MLLLYSLFFAWRANLDISRPLLLGVVSDEPWGLVRTGWENRQGKQAGKTDRENRQTGRA